MTITQAIGLVLAAFCASVFIAFIIGAWMHRCIEPGEDGTDEITEDDGACVPGSIHNGVVTK